MGGKHDPHFRIVIADSRKQRDGKAVEELGYYNPSDDPPIIKVDAERALHWLQVGAQPSDTVRSLLKKTGVMAQFHGTQQAAEAEAPEAATGPPQSSSQQGAESEDRSEPD